MTIAPNLLLISAPYFTTLSFPSGKIIEKSSKLGLFYMRVRTLGKVGSIGNKFPNWVTHVPRPNPEGAQMDMDAEKIVW